MLKRFNILFINNKHYSSLTLPYLFDTMITKSIAIRWNVNIKLVSASLSYKAGLDNLVLRYLFIQYVNLI